MSNLISIRAAVKAFLVLILVLPIVFLAYWKASDLYDNFTKPQAYVEKLCTPAMTKRLMCYCFSTYGRECPLDNIVLTQEMVSEKE